MQMLRQLMVRFTSNQYIPKILGIMLVFSGVLSGAIMQTNIVEQFQDHGRSLEFQNQTYSSTNESASWIFSAQDHGLALTNASIDGENVNLFVENNLLRLDAGCGSLPMELLLKINTGNESHGNQYQIPVYLAPCSSINESQIPMISGTSSPNATYGQNETLDSTGDFGFFAQTFELTVSVRDNDGDKLRGVSVSLYDREGNDGDKVYLQGRKTDDDGQAHFSVNCIQDAPGQWENIDPTIKVFLDNYQRLRIEDTSGNQYERVIDYYSQHACGSFSDTLYPPNSADDKFAWNIWDHLMDSYDVAKPLLGSNIKLNVRAPDSNEVTGAYYPADNRIHFNAISNVKTMHHEYGHFVDDIARGDVNDLPGGGPHAGCSDGAQDEGLAMTEGFASFWASLVSNRYHDNCSPRLGAENEHDVFQILFDICDTTNKDSLCFHSWNPESGDTVYDPEALEHYLSTLDRRPLNMYDWIEDFPNSGGSLRDFVVSAAHNGMTHYQDGTLINQAPKISQWIAPQSGNWYGSNIPLTVIIDDDTDLTTKNFQIKPQGSCIGSSAGSFTNPITFNGLIYAPSGIEDSSVNLCGYLEDELGLNSGQQEAPFSIKVDTKSPTSGATVYSSTPLALTWDVAWNSVDYGSGIDRTEIFEKGPLGEWVKIHSEYGASAASGFVTQSFLEKIIPGEYCYGSVARDSAGNLSGGPFEDACILVPVTI